MPSCHRHRRTPRPRLRSDNFDHIVPPAPAGGTILFTTHVPVDVDQNDGGRSSCRLCPQSDSNRHCADFKSAASANWAIGARRSRARESLHAHDVSASATPRGSWTHPRRDGPGGPSSAPHCLRDHRPFSRRSRTGNNSNRSNTDRSHKLRNLFARAILNWSYFSLMVCVIFLKMAVQGDF